MTPYFFQFIHRANNANFSFSRVKNIFLFQISLAVKIKLKLTKLLCHNSQRMFSICKFYALSRHQQIAFEVQIIKLSEREYFGSFRFYKIGHNPLTSRVLRYFQTSKNSPAQSLALTLNREIIFHNIKLLETTCGSLKISPFVIKISKFAIY